MNNLDYSDVDLLNNIKILPKYFNKTIELNITQYKKLEKLGLIRIDLDNWIFITPKGEKELKKWSIKD